MALRIRYLGAKVLREKAQAVTNVDEQTKAIAMEMKQLVDKYHGAGLAAPQVGLSIRLFVARLVQDEGNLTYDEWLKHPIQVFINPVLSEFSDEILTEEEGCLSIPGIRGQVQRPASVKIEALDIEGQPFSMSLEGRVARIVMHENDHLNGVLYFDRMKGSEKNKFKAYLKRVMKSRQEYREP